MVYIMGVDWLLSMVGTLTVIKILYSNTLLNISKNKNYDFDVLILRYNMRSKTLSFYDVPYQQAYSAQS